MNANEIDHVEINVWDRHGNHRHIDTENYLDAIRKLKEISMW